MSAGESVVYRRAEERDTEEILRLWMGMMSEHVRFDGRICPTPSAADAYAAYLAYHLKSPESLCLAAEAADRPAGGAEAPRLRKAARLAAYCLAFISQNLPMFEPRSFGFVSDVVVDEGWRGQGIGTELLARAKDWMRQKGITVVQLQVYTQNRRGAAFWAKQGFASLYERMWLDLE